MSSSEEQLRAMYLSGTVSIPPRFPDVADITFRSVMSGKKTRTLVVATQMISAKVTIKRTFFVEDVTCIFLPTDCSAVDLQCGEWVDGDEVGLKARACVDQDAIQGILYVREHAQSLLEVQAGLTAAESAEYYPPLPDDRSVNHYRMDKGSRNMLEAYDNPGCGF
jgi:hypothetical protein